MVRNTKQKRRPNSATSGGMMLGRISRTHDPAQPLAAQPRRLDIIHHHDIHRRGARQAEHAGRIEQREDEDQSRRPTCRRSTAASARRSGSGSTSAHRRARLRTWSSQPRWMAAKTPERAADREGQQRGDERDADRVAGAVDQARQHVAAELVGAEPEFGRSRADRLADDLGLAIGRDQRGEDRARSHRRR